MEAREDGLKWIFNWLVAALFVAMVPLLLPWKAAAGVIEASSGFSYNKTTYGDSSYTWTRRWSASLAYYFTEISSIELAYQDAYSRNKILGIEDTTFHDKIYSVNWVQHLTPRDFPVQPYFKLGIGQLNRDSTGNYATGGTPPQREDSVTGILGAGLKIYITKGFGLRGEGTTYLTGGRISTWRDNISATAGISFYF
jgi:hypothetical protein